MKSIVAACLSAGVLFLGACGAQPKTDESLHTVISKRHFVDEQGVEHWVLDCLRGWDTDKEGKRQNVTEPIEVDKERYDKTRKFNFVTGEIGDAC